MVKLENEFLEVEISPQGAELQSIVDRSTDYEYLWQGDDAYWGRRAPILFPIIGTLKDSVMTYQGQIYSMLRHGFARDMEFILQSSNANSASFNLKATEETKAHYPFDFSLQITYILFGSSLTVSYEILNESHDQALYYSIGGHPAFNVAHKTLANGQEEFDQVSLRFEPAGKYLQISLDKSGLANLDKATYVSMDNLNLTHELFKNDALIYQINRQTEAILDDPVNGVQIRLKPSRMDFMGIWTSYPARGAFVCLEPWAGLTDLVSANGNFEDKYGINRLEANQIATHDYSIDFIKSD